MSWHISISPAASESSPMYIPLDSGTVTDFNPVQERLCNDPLLPPTVPSLVCILPLNDEICPEDGVLYPPSKLPVADIEPLAVKIPVDDMLHCAVEVSTDV